MKLTLMFHDLFKSITSEPATERFPNPEPNEPERLRGKLHWDPANCTGCQLCVKDCPSDALKMFVIDKKKKQFVMTYDVGRCTFCAQCVQNCRFDCLNMAHDEWALSDYDKKGFDLVYGQESDIFQWLAETSPDNSGTDG